MGIYRHGVCVGFLDKINKIELSLSAQGKEEFRPNAF
jgi:hypothetical protein